MEFKNRVKFECGCGESWEDTLEGDVEIIYSEFGVVNVLFSARYKCPKCGKTQCASGMYGPILPVKAAGGELTVERVSLEE